MLIYIDQYFVHMLHLLLHIGKPPELLGALGLNLLLEHDKLQVEGGVLLKGLVKVLNVGHVLLYHLVKLRYVRDPRHLHQLGLHLGCHARHCDAFKVRRKVSTGEELVDGPLSTERQCASE